MDRFRIGSATLERELSTPYAYGPADCFHLGCAMADALHGTSLVEKYRGAYRTLKGAHIALRRRGFSNLVDFWSAELGQEPDGAASARYFDLVILRLADGAEHVGVCLGNRFTTKTERGRSDHGLSDVIATFHLG
ncbi:hypothetical protein FA04_13800 [Ensifer adhaerens]|uniref:DUF6950 domain-containing protein n=1 Tax=Ensifer adhaerens TaxID=106592 RepID=A0ABY8HC51_ENSAD|nr:hypothetical protein [Ensifer adhaerens]ANK73597.1 hypothetical protein FA04_13800 [Ensifer adhaerens]KDP73623.1 hypothetical protein FA04_11000 [Ensifer adhaerens]WFP89672.1 hypothetical protein P4B07_14020 [Ensifer adhaerens]